MRNNIANEQAQRPTLRKIGPPMGNRNSATCGSFTQEIKEEKKLFAVLLRTLKATTEEQS